MPYRPLVLIVDDSDRNRKLARDVLRAARFRTLEAATAAEGIALASEHLPDVILMDLRLPDLDGTEAARSAPAEPRTSGIPVVAVTALPLDARDEWLFDAGFAGYIVKPIDIDAFPGSRSRVLPARVELVTPGGMDSVERWGASIPRHMPAGTVGTRSTSSYVRGSGADAPPRHEASGSPGRRRREIQVGVGHRARRSLPRRVRRQRPRDARNGVQRNHAREGDLRQHLLARAHQGPTALEGDHQDAGASDLYVQQNTWQPGGSTGWHTHPGPSFVIVTQGSVTVYEGGDPSCTPHVYTANTPTNSFLDTGGGDVHLIRNETGAVAQTIAVQLIPASATRTAGRGRSRQVLLLSRFHTPRSSGGETTSASPRSSRRNRDRWSSLPIRGVL